MRDLIRARCEPDKKHAIAISGKKRWFQISLCNFLVVFTCIAVAVGWFSRSAQQRRGAFAAIRKAGGEIQMGIHEPTLSEEWFGPDFFSSVNKIDIRNGKADNKLLAQIGVLKGIRRLDLSYADIDDEGLRRIAHLPLRELWLQETDITDASATTLSKMSTLNFLQLNGTTLSDDFLENLQSLPHLENLGLRGTHVTGVGMKYLSRHPKLNQLDLYNTEVDGSGVEHLVGCPSLTDVGLSMTRVTNQVFEHLEKLPNLTNADLSANRTVTTEAVLAFEESHPSCNIEWHGK